MRGERVGHYLLERTAQYAVQHGKTLLRLDCFAEVSKLPAYYEGEGFESRGEFTVGDWHGRMYEKALLDLPHL